MGMVTKPWRFAWLWFSRAFTGKLSKADLLAGLAGIIYLAYLVAARRWGWPLPEDEGWQVIPLWVFAVVFVAAVVLGLLRAPYHLFREQEDLKIQTQKQLKAIEDARPSIEVTPKVWNGRAILEVENRGGVGEFEARGRVISGIPEPELYFMYWEAVPNVRCHIDAGGTASILVGERSTRTQTSTNIYEGDLVLFKMGSSGEQVFAAQTWVEIPPQILEGKDAIAHELRPVCTVEITITSTPTLSNPFSKRHFELEVYGNSVSFEPVSDLILSSAGMGDSVKQ